MTQGKGDLLWRFSGFPEGKAPVVRLPELVFAELVPHIDDLQELQVTLVVLWRLARRQARVAPWVTREELLSDTVLRQALEDAGAANLDLALARAVARGTLLEVTWERADGSEEWRYFANGPRGRMAVAALERGLDPAQAEVTERPNIYTLYEQNVGPLTALLSEDLREAEETFPAEWIEEAFREAVRLNKRSWKYIRAILERWQTEGRDEIDRRAGEEDGRRYIEGKYADFIQH